MSTRIHSSLKTPGLLSTLALFWQLVFLSVSLSCFAEKWTDVSGRHTVDASFVALEGDVVLLRRANGTQVRIPLDKLCAEARERVDKYVSVANGQPKDVIAPKLQNARELESLAKTFRSATHALKLYEGYLAREDLEGDDRAKAEDRLKVWQERAKEGRLRWGNRWLTIDEIRHGIREEDRYLKEAHRLMEVGNDELALERFLAASESNPEAVRADYYVGMLYLLLGCDPKNAEAHFSKCVSRLKQNPDRLIGTRRSNLIAALNNRAICRVRRNEHSKALKDWGTAIRMAPTTPELIQNLGYYAKLASVVPGWKVTRSASRKVADQYAKLTVANRTASFQESVGWLLVPYIDAPQLPDFEDLQFAQSDIQDQGDFLDLELGAENDFRVVDWATGVAVDQEHLLVARRSIDRSHGLWIRRDGKLRRDLPGKVVAISGSYDLALVRFRGLGAHVIPFETEDSKRATEIRALGFSEPGILENELRVSKGTIIDLASVYVPLGKQYLTSKISQSNRIANQQQAASETVSMFKTVAVPIGQEYVTSLIHDAPLSLGSLGAPLFNLQGKIVGIDLGGAEKVGSPGENSRAINHTEVRAFLDSVKMDYPAIDENPTGMIEDIDQFVKATAGSAVFQVAIVGRVPRLSWTDRMSSIRGIRTKQGWNAIEDTWCMRCNGKGEIACPERRCVGGWISHKESYVDSYLPGTNTPVMKQKWVKERCERCNASGKLRCPHCRGNKREPSL